jgi:hypothetical protein
MCAGPYTVGQSTFALQCIPRSERIGVLRGLKGAVTRLLIGEFDVSPALPAVSTLPKGTA